MSDYMPAHAGGVWPEPQHQKFTPPAEQPRPSNKRLFIVLGIVAVLIVGAVVGAIVATTGGASGRKITVHGTMVLSDVEGFTADDPNTDSTSYGVTGPCHTTSGYTDIAEGTEVVISDDAGKTLSIGRLGAGSFNSDGACSFPFTMTVPAGKRFYITVSHRGTVKMPEAEVTKAALSLGS